MLTVTSKCLEELETEQDLAFLKEQTDDLERNELDAEDTSVTTFGTTRTLSPQAVTPGCHMPGRLKCILIAAVCFELLQFAVIWSCSHV